MKYRVGRKQKRAILEVETGREYLIFPSGKEEDVKLYCDFLNGITNENISDIVDEIISRRFNETPGYHKYVYREAFTTGYKYGLSIKEKRKGIIYRIRLFLANTGALAQTFL